MPNACRTLTGIVLAGLAMSVGWGIRGDYGHEAGAMIPGALLGLAICVASGREDWRRRATIMGMCGAIGWAFGGQMSYGRVIGYTAASSLLDVVYGYASLFIIGGLWAGIGSAILAMSVTQPASHLERFARPLVALGTVWVILALTGWTDRLAERWYLNDTDWVGASSALLIAGVCALLFPSDRRACALIAVLAGGWWAGYLILVGVLGLHMTPPRSDNWAGCVGLFIALLAYLWHRKDRAALTFAMYGLLIGGIGFVLGDLANMLGRAQWGPIGRYEALQGLDYWKWMEQLFGLIMGLGVGAAFLTGVRERLSPSAEDSRMRRLRPVALVLLLLVMTWSNFSKNVVNWAKRDHIPPDLLGIGSTWWFLIIGALLSATVVVAIVRHYGRHLALSPKSAFGRGQLLFLLILWVSVIAALTQALPGMSSKGTFLVHVSFWITAGVCSLIVVMVRKEATYEVAEARPASDTSWRLGWPVLVCFCLMPFLLYAVAYLTVASHAELLPGSHLRFSDTSAASAPTQP